MGAAPGGIGRPGGEGTGRLMNETVVTVVGNAATDVICREGAAGGPVARFRLAAASRHWDRVREVWVDGPTSFYTVWARRSLAANLAESVRTGEPLVVRGRLRIRDEEYQGQRRTSADIDATAVGHDLSRGTTVFRRVSPAKPGLTSRPPAGSGRVAEDGAREQQQLIGAEGTLEN